MVTEAQLRWRWLPDRWLRITFILSLDELDPGLYEATSTVWKEWLPSWLIPHGHRPRSELLPAHELQVDRLRQAGEQRRPMAGQPGMHDEFVLIDQSQLCQRSRERHASHEQSLARHLLEPRNGALQISAQELRVPIDPAQGARYDVFSCRVDLPCEGFQRFGPRPRPIRRAKGRLHHLIGHPTEKKCIGAVENLCRVTMQSCVRDDCTMIAAAVQGDVDGISKRSHARNVPGDRRGVQCPQRLR